MKTRVFIWGAGGHAKVIGDILIRMGNVDIVGFIDTVNPDRKGHRFCGKEILGGEEELLRLIDQGIKHAVIAIGDCKSRLKISEFLIYRGVELLKAVHPSAILAADVQVGAGTVVAAGAIINAGAQVGYSSIINTGAIVEHDCTIDKGVHLSPGVRLGGGVAVGEGAWIGIGATVIDHIRVGRWSIVGAGAVVIDDIPEFVVSYGVPARFIRPINPSLD